MDLQPKLSLRTQLMGLSPKYNDLGLGSIDRRKERMTYVCKVQFLVNVATMVLLEKGNVN